MDFNCWNVMRLSMQIFYIYLNKKQNQYLALISRELLLINKENRNASYMLSNTTFF